MTIYHIKSPWYQVDGLLDKLPDFSRNCLCMSVVSVAHDSSMVVIELYWSGDKLSHIQRWRMWLALWRLSVFDYHLVGVTWLANSASNDYPHIIRQWHLHQFAFRN